ncbi:MAG: gamma-glutamylcyclotransferase [Chloroflexaceae bacterium]|nr:gamma-glutamylcyclotransferase [Chloroflexaceae bacterium]
MVLLSPDVCSTVEHSLNILPIFVYGTLKPGYENHDMIVRSVIKQEPAVLHRAALYTQGAYPFLVQVDDLCEHEDCVKGLLMLLSSGHYAEQLAQMDELEGTVYGLYERILVTVETSTGLQQSWCYTAGPKVLQAIRTGRLVKVNSGVW